MRQKSENKNVKYTYDGILQLYKGRAQIYQHRVIIENIRMKKCAEYVPCVIYLNVIIECPYMSICICKIDKQTERVYSKLIIMHILGRRRGTTWIFRSKGSSTLSALFDFFYLKSICWKQSLLGQRNCPQYCILVSKTVSHGVEVNNSSTALHVYQS